MCIQYMQGVPHHTSLVYFHPFLHKVVKFIALKALLLFHDFNPQQSGLRALSYQDNMHATRNEQIRSVTN